MVVRRDIENSEASSKAETAVQCPKTELQALSTPVTPVTPEDRFSQELCLSSSQPVTGESLNVESGKFSDIVSTDRTSQDAGRVHDTNQDIRWGAIETISDLIVLENLNIWDENYLFRQLEAAGYGGDVIDSAILWIQEAARTGGVEATVGFIHERNISRNRIESQSESAYFSRDLWHSLETLRIRGVIGISMMEKLLAGIREIDTRDWEDAEVEAFIDAAIRQNLDPFSRDFSAVDQIDDDAHMSKPYRPYC